MAQQTALQFFLMGLVDLEIGKGIPTDKEVELRKLFEQAKQMEKEQIIKTWYDCKLTIVFDKPITGEDYYIEKYSKQA